MKYTKFKAYSQLMRLDKPIGIFLLLWPTLMALWLAGHGKPPIFMIFIFIVGVIVMRSAGCVINDIADREVDKAVARTKCRPLASKRIKLYEAWVLFLILISLALLLALQLNKTTLYLSVIGLSLAIIYPFMKRYIDCPQLFLGVAFGWSIPMVFSALDQAVPLSAILLYLATICWVIAYDTEYAMVDREDDLRIGIKSTAILFGRYDRLIIGIFQVTALGLYILLGLSENLGKIYHVSLGIAWLMAAYQQNLIKDRNPTLCFKAFLNNNAFGATIFIGVVFDRLIA